MSTRNRRRDCVNGREMSREINAHSGSRSTPGRSARESKSGYSLLFRGGTQPVTFVGRHEVEPESWGGVHEATSRGTDTGPEAPRPAGCGGGALHPRRHQHPTAQCQRFPRLEHRGRDAPVEMRDVGVHEADRAVRDLDRLVAERVQSRTRTTPRADAMTDSMAICAPPPRAGGNSWLSRQCCAGRRSHPADMRRTGSWRSTPA